MPNLYEISAMCFLVILVHVKTVCYRVTFDPLSVGHCYTKPDNLGCFPSRRGIGGIGGSSLSRMSSTSRFSSGALICPSISAISYIFLTGLSGSPTFHRTPSSDIHFSFSGCSRNNRFHCFRFDYKQIHLVCDTIII